YPIAAIVGSTPLPPQGPLVLPGKYEVRLNVGEQVFRQPLEVKMDPRVVAARNELQSSLELQLKISALLEKNFVGYQQTKGWRGLRAIRRIICSVSAHLQGFERSSCGLAGTEEQRRRRAEQHAGEKQSRGAARGTRSSCRYGLRKLRLISHFLISLEASNSL